MKINKVIIDKNNGDSFNFKRKKNKELNIFISDIKIEVSINSVGSDDYETLFDTEPHKISRIKIFPNK